MNFKTYLILCLLFLNNFLIQAQVYNYAEDFPNPKDNSDSFICDPEDYLTSQEENEINALSEEMRDQKGYEVAVVIVRSINNFEPLPMATDIINLWGVGKDDKGILLLIAVDDRNMAFATGYASEELFPDLITKKISEEEMTPYFKTNQYGKGIISGVSVIRNIIMDENIPSYVEETYILDKNIKNWRLYALIICILVIALTVYVKPDSSTIITIGVIIFITFVLSIITYGIVVGKKGNNEFFTSFFGIFLFIAVTINAFIVLKKNSNSLYLNAILSVLAFPVPFIGLYLYGFKTFVLIYIVATGILFGFFLIFYSISLLIKDPYKKYGLIRVFKLDFLAYIFPLPMYIVVLLVEKLMDNWRNQVRFSKKTGLEMRKLCEIEDDKYLQNKEITEEKVKSVDYDVWISEEKDDVLILRYDKWFSGYSNCSKCKAKTWYLVYDRTITAATYSSSGTGERKKACAHCKHQEISRYTIAQLQQSSSSGGSSSSSSSSGGSWGGGRSGGGGSSSRW